VPFGAGAFSGKPVEIPNEFALEALSCGTKGFSVWRSLVVKKAGPVFFREVEDADGLPDALQGKAEGLGLAGVLEYAVEAHIQEVKLVEDLPLEMLVPVVVQGFPMAGEPVGGRGPRSAGPGR
jgi:hypothetical protein